MQAIELAAEIDQNHQIHLQLPETIGSQKAKVIVMYEATEQAGKRKIEQQNWLDFLDQTYGCLADDPIERPEQAELKEIDAL